MKCEHDFTYNAPTLRANVMRGENGANYLRHVIVQSAVCKTCGIVVIVEQPKKDQAA